MSTDTSSIKNGFLDSLSGLPYQQVESRKIDWNSSVDAIVLVLEGRKAQIEGFASGDMTQALNSKSAAAAAIAEYETSWNARAGLLSVAGASVALSTAAGMLGSEINRLDRESTLRGNHYARSVSKYSESRKELAYIDGAIADLKSLKF